jgi:hypothetical protein
MLDIKVTIHGDKIVIENLQQIAKGLPNAIDRGLSRVATDIHRRAFDFLNGAGSKGLSREVTSKKGTKYLKWEKRTSPISAGGYPVPIRTGNLRGRLNNAHDSLMAFLHPNESRTVGGNTFTTGDHEAMVFNAAEYAGVIHDGRGSSAKFGPRRFLTDALEAFNSGGKIKAVMEEEIEKLIKA